MLFIVKSKSWQSNIILLIIILICICDNVITLYNILIIYYVKHMIFRYYFKFILLKVLK
jgi:hypothetical protein